MSRDLWNQAAAHLRGGVEQVGFFLADTDPMTRGFAMRDWRAVPPEGVAYRNAYHITLTDEMKNDVIRWAWDAHASLVEAHSHSELADAEFSPSDLWGFRDWVPHLLWRLRGCPYGALIAAGDSFDALAWFKTAERPEQVERIELDDGVLTATRRTMRALDHDERHDDYESAR